MNIILTERINNLGKLGEVVKVKAGYARNYLLPQGKAIRATKENLEIFEKERSQREAENIKNIKEAESLSEEVKGLSIVILRSASETGQLYGSVSNRDISRLVTDNGFTISYKQVILNKTIKELGIHFIDITLHPEVIIEIKLNVARTKEEAEIQEKTGEAVIEVKEEEEEEANLSLDSEINSETDTTNKKEKIKEPPNNESVETS
jgi:large subunit ribosomal protein L9